MKSTLEKRKPMGMLLPLVLAIFVIATPCLGAQESQTSGPGDVLTVTGTIANAKGKGVREAEIRFFIDGKEIEPEKELLSENRGTYKAELLLPAGTLPATEVAMHVRKPCYEDTGPVALAHIIQEKSDGKGSTSYLAHQNVVLKRIVGPAFWIATSVLIAVYGLIAFEVMHRTLAALLGAATLLFVSYTAGSFSPDYVILTFEHAVHAIDMNVIFLLMAMMMIVGVLKKTGLIQIIADWVHYMSKGSVVVAVVVILWVSALASAIIDNIPFTATMLPIVAYLGEVVPGAESGILWWALALGACLGGNGTMIGASANVVTVGIAESQGYRISFMGYMKIAFVPMIISIVLCTIWLLLV